MRHPLRLFLNDVVNALTGQTLPDMAGDLTDELVGDDGDVLDARPTNGAESVIDDGALVKGQQGFLRVSGKGPQTRAVTSSDEDGLDRHGPNG